MSAQFDAKTVDDSIQREIDRLLLCLPRAPISNPIHALKTLCERDLKIQLDFEEKTKAKELPEEEEEIQVRVVFYDGDMKHEFVPSAFNKSKKRAKIEAARNALESLGLGTQADEGIKQLFVRAAQRNLSH
eukprot:TRINITY_DN9312_c0_g1_i1.p1 TRINITY_DN9312_c0_g1~~TRINITY_DN9312_c0_g1_i1.p1  ORF type:complete len:131 (-),score=38.42 TRINITY_DN9312_c0_g1_i1:99-491(-)